MRGPNTLLAVIFGISFVGFLAWLAWYTFTRTSAGW